MFRHHIRLTATSLTLTFMIVALFAPPSGAQKAEANKSSNELTGTRAKRQRSTIRDVISSEELPKQEQAQRQRSDRVAIAQQQRVNPDRPGVATIPHWSDSFTYHGLTYKYTMVGTDPKRGSATTTIPTIVIPLRFVFENGRVIDASTDIVNGQTAIHGTINSPIFQPQDFNVGGVSVGNTQFGDAYQRANFWNLVSRQSPNYHVQLGQPTVGSLHEVFVPNDEVSWDLSGRDGSDDLPLFSPTFLDQVTTEAIERAHISPQTLPIVVWGRAIPNGFYPFHGAYPAPGGIQTYISAGYFLEKDVWDLSKGLLGWMTDPFMDNYTPGWNQILEPYDGQCGSTREVSDKLEGYGPFGFYDFGITIVWSFITDSGTYHLSNAAFLDYFARESSSRSAGGQYFFFDVRPIGFTNSPSQPCMGHIEVEQELLEFPDAISTRANGINNHDVIVGDFRDASNRRHGFLYDGTNFQQLDYPGARSTIAYKINDTGKIVGSFTDMAGLTHGFLYVNGGFTPIDFPGSIDHTAIALGINNRGDIVGEYDLTVEITHGFILQNGQYRSLDTPFASQTEARGINDWGVIVGDTYDDPFAGPFTGFTLDRNVFERFDIRGYFDVYETFPITVNNLGMQGGIYDLARLGYVTIYGYPYRVYGNGVWGMNDNGQIVGNTTTLSGQTVGYVATLPK